MMDCVVSNGGVLRSFEEAYEDSFKKMPPVLAIQDHADASGE